MSTGKQQVYTVGANSLALSVANSLAYFTIWYAKYKYQVEFDDPLLAMAMLGVLYSAGMLEFRRLGQAARYVFDRLTDGRSSDS